MKESIVISEEPGRLSIQCRRIEQFDLSVLSPGVSEDLFLECSGQNPAAAMVAYTTQGLICLEAFLKQIQFDRLEACSFLHSLFSSLASAARNQPVILDMRCMFLTPRAEQIRFARAPLILEVWMKRKEEFERFYMALLEHFDCDALEIYGLLWKAVRESLSPERFVEEIEILYQSCTRRRFFQSRPQIPAYTARKAVFLSEEGYRKEDGRNGFFPWKRNRAVFQQPMHNPSADLQIKSSPVSLETGFSEAVPESGNPVFSRREEVVFEPQPEAETMPAARLLSETDSLPFPRVAGWLFEETSGFAAKKTPPFSTDLTQDFTQEKPALKKDEQAAFADPFADLWKLSSAEPEDLQPHREDREAVFQAAGGFPDCLTDPPDSPAARPAAGTGVCHEEDFLNSRTVLVDALFSSCALEMDGQMFPLEEQEILLGRSENCQIRLEDPSVSQQHARLTCTDGRWYIQDLHSTNGTWIGSKKVIRRMRLKEGMVIRFGSRSSVFRQQPVCGA